MLCRLADLPTFSLLKRLRFKSSHSELGEIGWWFCHFLNKQRLLFSRRVENLSDRAEPGKKSRDAEESSNLGAGEHPCRGCFLSVGEEAGMPQLSDQQVNVLPDQTGLASH